MTSVRSQQHHYKNLRLLGELEIESYNKKKSIQVLVFWVCPGGVRAVGGRAGEETTLAHSLL